MASTLGITLPRLVPHQVCISLTAPLTPRSLLYIRGALDRALQSHKPFHIAETELNAAVLVPLANVNGSPGIVLELRGNLRQHAGEVSFPGGRVDDRDSSFLAGALREADEEIALQPAQVEILGELGPPERSLSGLRVWPYVGFVHHDTNSSIPVDATRQIHPRTESDTYTDMDAPLPSISMSSFHASQPEVEHVFHLPFSQLVQPSRLRAHMFRGQRPYWAVNVTDIVASSAAAVYDGRSGEGDEKKVVEWAGETDVDEVGGGRGGKLEVWGLTGWYLNLLMRAMGVYV